MIASEFVHDSVHVHDFILEIPIVLYISVRSGSINVSAFQIRGRWIGLYFEVIIISVAFTAIGKYY